MGYPMTTKMLTEYRNYLRLEEKSLATIEKYLRDLTAFWEWLPADKLVDKERMLIYKEKLQQNYAPASVNSMLVAINGFFSWQGWQLCRVRQLKLQRNVFCDQQRELSKEDYLKLLLTAQQTGQQRLWMVMQTICATGIRVSELSWITVEAVRQGRANIACKGKNRVVFLPKDLVKQLRGYIQQQALTTGPVFRTRVGQPLHRSSIWRSMKQLCDRAGLSADKVFPHNLRHLFARTYYAQQKDLAHLADLLGHSSVNTTRIYTMTSGDEQRKQLDQLGLVAKASGSGSLPVANKYRTHNKKTT